MSVSFVQSVRSRPDAVHVGGEGPLLRLRVQIPEFWDVVKVRAAESRTVLDVKKAVLAELVPMADELNYVMKLRGLEVLDEGQSLADSGAIDGSIFLLSHRRRRPVR
ncbi:MAG TPA: hypothetical protein VMM77_08510 [Gemmatimonadaceae bacterium]|nr:hypothetical protein [Gemmatimonadaceae bacterium]